MASSNAPIAGSESPCDDRNVSARTARVGAARRRRGLRAAGRRARRSHVGAGFRAGGRFRSERAERARDGSARRARRPTEESALALAAGTAAIALALHDRTDAAIILAIVVSSVGLGAFNEYRSVRAIADLRAQVRPTARALRDGALAGVDAASLVAGDIVDLSVGDIVPADLRLFSASALSCDEATLTGESLPAEKTVDGAAPAEPLRTCALAGTIVRAGSGRGVVVAIGAMTQIGRIASRVGAGAPETAFQRGLRSFSSLLVWITAVVTSIVFVVNAIVHHSIFESLLFALAIAVSLTPQLLPAIVTVSLATGPAHGAAIRARQTAREHRGPRQHDGALHRQDGHADGRPRLVHGRNRRRRNLLDGGVAPGTPLHGVGRGRRRRRARKRDRCARRGAVGGARCGGCRLRALASRCHCSVRLRAPRDVGHRRRRHATARHHERSAGVRLRAMPRPHAGVPRAPHGAVLGGRARRRRRDA